MSAPTNRNWYSRNRLWLRMVAGQDRYRLLGHELSLWTPRSSSTAAAHYAFAAHNAWEDGAPLKVARTRREATRYRNARDAGRLPPLPAKMRTFAAHLCDEVAAPGPSAEWIMETVESWVYP